MTETLLAIQNVSKSFGSGSDRVLALDDVSLDMKPGECLAVVGESGSGKSTLANLILGIYPPTKGGLCLKGQPLPPRREKNHRRAIQLVQQNPLSALNPKRRIGASLQLALDVHGIGAKSEQASTIASLLDEVGLPADFAERFPAALSGGQRQRVAIARALACQSELVVFDEPTSALDVLVQARILRLLIDLKAKRGLTYIFITHDLAVVRNLADRVAVFERGRLVDLDKTEEMFERPAHAYTRRLISAVPVITDDEQKLRDRLTGRSFQHDHSNRGGVF